MVKREIKEKEEQVDKKTMNELINLALASSKVKKITVEQENGEFDMRTNINIFIYGQIGGTKSTLLNEIAKKTKSIEPFTDLTYPALIGSVDKMTKQLLIGACWECRNSLLLLDEFDFGKREKSDIRALLQLIEGGKYNKKMASFSAKTEEEDEDLRYKFENGQFNIRTRFSLVLVTMKYPYTSQNQELQALITRSICLPWYPEKKDLMRIAQGYPLFNFVDKTPKNLEIRVKKTDYDKIYNYVFDRTNHPNALRIIGDCTRIFAIEKKHRTDLYDLLIKLGTKKFQSKAPKK